MCCIIHRTKDSNPILQQNLEKIIKKNPDGWGISYINDEGILIVTKSMDMKLSIDKIREVEKLNKEFLFHARYATHGLKNEANCHPYNYIDGVMFHNGRMKDVGVWNKNMSDTWHFIGRLNKFLKKGKPLNELISNKFKSIVDKSRLAFMLNDGTVIKYGETNDIPKSYKSDSWYEIDGNFFSKNDWEYVSLAPVYREVYTTHHRVANVWNSAVKTVGSKEYIDSITSAKRESVEDSSSTDESLKATVLEGVLNSERNVKAGNVTDKDIETLSIDQITELNQSFPETMAKYLFKLISREIN